MQRSLKIEELFMFILGVYLFTLLHIDWWWFPVLILLPDIGMLGYLKSSKIGAVTYNLFHHKGIAIALYFLGMYLENYILQLIGIILFSHSAMDRMLGYGLKFEDSFYNTHLGRIGKEK